MGERPLPLVKAPVALVTPHAARLLSTSWRAIEEHYRANAVEMPPELVDLAEAIRQVAAWRTSAVGSAVDGEAAARASSADGDETSEHERSGSTTAEGAGKRLGLSGRQVRNLLRQGRLAGEQVGRTWVVDDAAIEEYRTLRSEVG
jgi:hypothetical protein